MGARAVKRPDQLRCEPHLDGLVLTLAGVREDHFWQRHPLVTGVGALALGALMVATHAYLGGLVGLVTILAYQHFTTGDVEQQRIQVEPDRIRFHHHDLVISELDRIELDENAPGPVIWLHGRGTPAALYMQLEPMEHGRWLRDFLRDARKRTRESRGFRHEVPRALRRLRE